VHVNGDLPNADFHLFSSRLGFLGLFPMGGSLFRLVASAPADHPANQTAGQLAAASSQADAPTLDEFQAIYDQRSHIPARLAQLTWSSVFHINSRMVNTLRVGRIFLAGDAAHIHSPAGAQGMNTGIQDAMNLAWKLALVMQGKAAEKLLDTYEQDRLPVMRSILTRTEGLTDAMGGDSLMRTFFVHIAPWIAHGDFAQDLVTARISQIALNYRTSPLSDDHFGDGALSAGDRVPDVSVRVFLPGVRGEGSSLAEAESGVPAEPSFPAGVEAGSQSETRRLFTMLSPTRFTLLLANVTDPTALRAQLFNSLAPWHDLIETIHIAAPEGEGRKAFAEAFGVNPSITLVRPDAYVGFRGGQSTAGDLIKYCNQWLVAAARKQAA
jgi:hypothetical protein